MGTETRLKINVFLGLVLLYFATPALLPGYEIFIYRPLFEKDALSRQGKIIVHGDFFGQFQTPSTFPSFNDLSGGPDRWNYGFRTYVFLTDTTRFLAQLVTHDDTTDRTKFDWHFSLRQAVARNIVLILGHDSDHDSDHLSIQNGMGFYTNRNYIGVGLPFEGKGFYIEPFTWFFHHTNQRSHLDLSGNKLRQEFGLRMGASPQEKATLSFQIVFQTEPYFSLGQAYLIDFVVRIEMTKWLQLAFGASLWRDIGASRLGNQKQFYKYIWGIAVPF